jgi:hypothetical protein
MSMCGAQASILHPKRGDEGEVLDDFCQRDVCASDFTSRSRG